MSDFLTENLDISEEIETSRTYKNNWETISSEKTDGIDAVKNAILKSLSTDQYEYPIYSFEYGIYTADLIGKDEAFVVPELKRRIKECLLRDDRVIDVSNFNYIKSGDSITLSFTVCTIFGNVDSSKEVTYAGK